MLDLRKYFNPSTVGNRVKTMPLLRSPIMDKFFSNSRQHTFPVIGIDEIIEITKIAPVVKRGAGAVSIAGNSKSISYIEPQPAELFDMITATELNNLKLMGSGGVQTFVDGKIDKIRRAVRKISEGLCSQALTGAISFPMKTSNGTLTTYDVDFGSVLNFTPGTLIDADGAKVETVLDILIEMEATIQEESGYGSEVTFLAGKTAYMKIAGLVTSLQNNSRIIANVNEKAIQIGGFTIELANYQTYNLITDSYDKVIGDKKIVAIAKDAPFTFFYVAIDDIDAGLQALPLYFTSEKLKDPSAIKVIGKSKPFPVPVPKAICWSTVVS